MAQKQNENPENIMKHFPKSLDHSFQVAMSKATKGLSPASLMLAYFDWYFHLLIQPSKQLELLDVIQQHFWQSMYQFIHQFSDDPSAHIEHESKDKRFKDPSWQTFPFHPIYESFLGIQDFWHIASQKVRGVNKHHQNVVDFSLRQILDMMSPSNFPWTNPEVQKKTIEENGENFIRGFQNFMDDLRREQMNEPPAGAENYIIGQNIAITSGKVVYRNRLIELIQYAPETKQTFSKPVLITPAWIMKYYILDLTPKHSLVKYLIDHGHTVFMISWKNPDEKDRDLSMQDYLNLGIMNAFDVISAIIPNQKINLVGYCLGGTLSAIAAAKMARDNDNRINSLTLFAAQTDFKEPGELGLFIDESQIAFLESLMKDKGYLDTHQMAGAFQLLRSNDLIWSRIIREYLLGERKPLSDLMAWNADATRLPFRMHSEYLRQLFLNNELAEAKFKVDDGSIALSDIKVPIFVVATERDHVSPWHSVFKINLLIPGNVTFVLTSGGHNVGIVSNPDTKIKRHYRISCLKRDSHYINADKWFEKTKPKNGSWWPAWETWLEKLSDKKTKSPRMGTQSKKYRPLYDAPGKYVLDK